MMTFKIPLSILVIFLLLNIFQCSSEVLYIPVTKDASTLQYIIEVGQKTPLIPTKLLLHLGGKSLWVDCTNSTTHTSSTYKSAVCNSTECSMAKSYGCGDCKFRSELQPGCNNNTCYIWGENPIKKMYHDGSEVAEDVLTIGSSPGVLVTSPRFIFTCLIDPYMLEKLANGVTGVAGFGQTTPITVPNQLGSDPRFSRKFGMCLSSSRGVIFIGPNPYYLYNPNKIDISNSKDLAYTKLLVNKRGFLQTDEYYFQMSSIRVAGQDVPLNKTLLIINKKRHGTDGTSISTAIPYTILHTTFYDSVKTAFINALPKNVTIVEPPPMSPFATCFSSENIKNTNVGPDVPPIDIVFYKPSVFWRISGANSMIQVSKDVMCLAFVRQDQTWLPSIVIGGYQLEENLLVFDLPGRKIGFSSSLKLKQTSCSQYDNTIMDKVPF
ncbi:probable aspartic proteinase GIP2 isoform X1 [Solanum stenotomum]|nr:probable aspartic proteinase GIP2 isoform X1 [Solanum stenotomum]